MFRAMRRARQQMISEDALAIMEKGRTGVLAVAGDDGYPYAVPLNYVWHEDKIYFHCAKAGHKLDAIQSCDKVSLCVVDRDQVDAEKFTTLYRSCVAFGRARVLAEPSEMLTAIRLLNRKYAPGLATKGEDEIRAYWDALCLVEIRVEHLTCKQGRELLSESRARSCPP